MCFHQLNRCISIKFQIFPWSSNQTYQLYQWKNSCQVSFSSWSIARLCAKMRSTTIFQNGSWDFVNRSDFGWIRMNILRIAWDWRFKPLKRWKDWILGSVARQDADYADSNKDVRMEAKLLIPCQKGKPYQKSSPVAKQLWFGYTTPINNAAPHQSIVCLDVAKLFSSAHSWTRIAIFIECLRTEQAERSQRRHWLSWMLG